MREAVEPAPRPSLAIVTDPDAHAAHDAAVDAWGATVSLAAGRICRWMVSMGADYDFCPPGTAP